MKEAVRLAWLASVVLACGPGSGEGLDPFGRPQAPGRDGGAQAGEISFRWLVDNVFGPVCATKCHVGASAPKGLMLDEANAYRLLVGVPSVGVPALLRVKPGAPEESYLVVKIRSSDPRRVGERMPRNGPPYLSEAQVAAVEAWIAAGAATEAGAP